MRSLFVKKKFLDLILAGKKSVEVRVCYSSFEKLKTERR
jgi:ASC-1-like (ASCH) protein